MKIMIINPNSSEAMTKNIQETANQYAEGRYEVEAVATPGSPEFIDSYLDAQLAIPGMMKIVKENEVRVDAFIIACHGDPGIDVLKEISQKPVVGIGEASMKCATMLGHKFSVLTTSKRSIGGKEAVINNYHLTECIASVCAPENEDENADPNEVYLEAANRALREDGAEVLVLGCAGLTGLDTYLMEKVPAPVLDGIKCALAIAEGIIRMGLGISRIGRYCGH